jgi:hypothetical protein
MDEWKSAAREIRGKDRTARTARRLEKEYGIARDDVKAYWDDRAKLTRRRFIGIPLAVAAAIAGAEYLPQYLRRETRPPFEVFPTLPGVERVFDKSGDRPDVIYIYLSHPHSRSVHSIPTESTVDGVAAICTALYDSHGVRSLLLEGVDESIAKEYQRGFPLRLRSSNETIAGKSDIMRLYGIANSRAWRLYPGESSVLSKEIRALEAPIEDQMRRFDTYVDERMLGLQRSAVTTQDLEHLFERLSSDISQERRASQQAVDTLLTPERCQSLYDRVVIRRNRIVLQESLEACRNRHEGPLVVIYGFGHGPDLLRLFRQNGLGYVSLVPLGSSPGRDYAEPLTQSTFIENQFRIPEAELVKNRIGR